MPDQELDVRPLLKPDKHPRIFQLFGALAVGESFVLVNNHDPRHLRREFETEYPSGFGWDYLDRGPAEMSQRHLDSNANARLGSRASARNCCR
jgi:uncharacterized protein (DUF2249 family)